MNTVALYERMSELSATMAEAARANDWDHLSNLELEIRQIRDKLQMLEPAEGPAIPLSGTDRQRKMELIKQILQDDREVRRHTEPWMESVRAMLGGNARGRAVRAAYNSFATK
ncbi:MAG: flagellar protein FliT [Betaproteobacteria bacterium]|nr:flagellar protein FliT [Betaproteobacteria bacterium]